MFLSYLKSAILWNDTKFEMVLLEVAKNLKFTLIKKMDNKFSCPKCKTKVPFMEVFKFKTSHVTTCSHCDLGIVPKNIKSWNFGFFVGFVSVVIPAFLILRYYNNFPLAMLIGVGTGLLGIFSMALYTYIRTEFKEAD